VLKGLAFEGDNSEADDLLYLDVMKQLRESKLLLREDIRDYDILYWACDPYAPMRFEYLIDWCPEGLKTHRHEGLPLIHAIIPLSFHPFLPRTNRFGQRWPCS
jgi:hypothetical protein